MSNEINIRNSTIFGLIWRFAERIAAQTVSFIVSIILARLLSPNDYGFVAMVTIFITISQVFVDSGLANALIQKKDADNLDFSTVFYFNILMCCVLYLFLYIIAPYVANFYQVSELTNILRVLGIVVIISAFKNVIQAYISKKMLFKKFFFATIGGTIISAIIGISMAYLGCGVWALIAQQLSNTLIDTIVLYITVKWRPQLIFSFERLKKLFDYGWKILVSSLIDTTYNNIRQLIIGKLYSSSELAYYDRGMQMPNIIITNINTSIDSVLLPALSKEQDSIDRVRLMTKRAIKTSGFILFPMMVGLAVIAEPLIRLLLTEKWLPCVPYLRLFCLVYAFQPIQTSNLNAIKALGRSDIVLKLEIIKKIIGLVFLIILLPFGPYAIAYSLLIHAVIASIINAKPNKEQLEYGYIQQIKDIMPIIIVSILMGIVIYPISLLNLNDFIIIVLQIIAGVISYIVLSYLFKIDSFYYVIDLIKSIFGKKNIF